MSSIDQAFVKSFSRRSRTEADANPPSDSSQSDSSQSDSSQNVPAGSLNVDPSVSQSASVWIDDSQDQVIRSDARQASTPKPHLASDRDQASTAASARDQHLESLQHVHTAIAIGSVSCELVDTTRIDLLPERSATPPDELAEPIVETRIDPPLGHSGSPSSHQHPPAVRDMDSPVPTEAATAADFLPPEPAPAIEPLRAAWEVDVFDVPATVADLFFEGQLFQQIAERMMEAVENGLGNVLVTSVSRGEGRSSVALGMAMAAAAAGIRVALVDGDGGQPTLADTLRLDLEHGWFDAVRGGLPLKEVAVHAVEDGITLIPLIPANTNQPTVTADEACQLMEMLNRHFDLVIVDGPAATTSDIRLWASQFDSAVIVCDQRHRQTAAIATLAAQLQQATVPGIGLVENFG